MRLGPASDRVQHRNQLRRSTFCRGLPPDTGCLSPLLPSLAGLRDIGRQAPPKQLSPASAGLFCRLFDTETNSAGRRFISGLPPTLSPFPPLSFSAGLGRCGGKSPYG